MQNSTGQAFGIASVILGAITFGFQIIGGLLCGWLGWPLGIAAIICGIAAFLKGSKLFGLVGITLSIIGVILQIVVLGGIVNSLQSNWQ